METENNNQTIRFFPLQRQQMLSTPQRMLKQYMARASDGDQLAYYLQTRPQMRTIVSRLARYLTAVIPGAANADRTLFDECLALATKEWAFAVAQAREPQEQTAYFMRGLLAPVPNLQRLTVMGLREGKAWYWNPLEKTLLRWSRDLEGFPMVLDEAPEEYWAEWRPVEFRLIVLSRFLCTEPRLERLVASQGDFITGL